jgi:penicillin-insensitive murein endopeptidase
VRPAILITCAVLLGGCPRQGVVDDGTSVSWGPSNRGKLMNPDRLPARGTGYWIPPRWNKRGLAYGTDEMTSMVAYLGRRIDERYPGARLSVADLSRWRGGPSAWHRSHQTGRDVDLLYFARDGRGKPVYLDRMAHFKADGSSKPAKKPDGTLEPTVHFDDARNWFLIRALMENPVAEVQYAFMYRGLKQRLLDYAKKRGEPADIIAKASYIMRQPGDSAIHDDHMHVRIYCAKTDREVGCVDYGRLRWTKKWRKYGGGSPHLASMRVPRRRMRRMGVARMPAMLVLTALLPR